MNDTVFPTDTAIRDAVNKGIEKAERIIHNTHEGYFETYINLPLTTSKDFYDMPVDIYANKITKILYNTSSDAYEIKPIKLKSDTMNMDSDSEYRYLLTNPANVVVSGYVSGTKTVTFKSRHYLSVGDSCSFYQSDQSTARGTADVVASVTSDYVVVLTTGIGTLTSNDVLRVNKTVLRLYPTSRETSTSNVEIWYYRNARRMVNDADILDIPEFESFVTLYAKYKILLKDIANPMLGEVKEELKQDAADMIETLSNMRPDGNTDIVQDWSFYEEFDSI